MPATDGSSLRRRGKLRNEKWKFDNTPIDPNLVGIMNDRYSKAYIKHLLKAMNAGMMIASVHNLQFYLWLVNEARQKINEGNSPPGNMKW